MRATRLQLHLEQCVRRQALARLEPGDGGARRVGVDRRAGSGRRRSRPIGASMRPLTEARVATDEREVTPLDLPSAHGASPAADGGRWRTRRDDEQARRVTVEAVDDPGTDVVTTARAERRAPDASVPVSCRPAGCTTRPAGLSTTRRCSSSQATGIPSSVACNGSSGGSSTTTASPVTSRRLFGSATPSTVTAPAARSRSACARDAISGRAASTRSSREPPSRSGT